MSKPDGGPAFPSLQEISQFDEAKARYVAVYLPFGGMSLRDWFAGMALGALVADMERWNGDRRRHDPMPVSVVAESAYQVADAMIAARSCE